MMQDSSGVVLGHPDAIEGLFERGHTHRSRDEEIVITDSLPIAPQMRLPNMRMISIAPLLGEAIRRIHRNESVSYLFD